MSDSLHPQQQDEEQPLPDVQAGDSTMRRPRYDPHAIARKMNAIVEDLNEEGKLNDQQYLALQNCARDVFNFPMASARAPPVEGIGDDLRVLLAHLNESSEERGRQEALRAVERAQREEQRVQREAEREQRSRERTAELQRRAAENARQLRLREQRAAVRVKQEELERQRAAARATQAAQEARERKAQEEDLKEQGVWLQPPPAARKRPRPAPARKVIRDDDSDSDDDFASFIANNMQERAAGSN